MFEQVNGLGQVTFGGAGADTFLMSTEFRPPVPRVPTSWSPRLYVWVDPVGSLMRGQEKVFTQPSGLIYQSEHTNQSSGSDLLFLTNDRVCQFPESH